MSRVRVGQVWQRIADGMNVRVVFVGTTSGRPDIVWRNQTGRGNCFADLFVRRYRLVSEPPEPRP